MCFKESGTPSGPSGVLGVSNGRDTMNLNAMQNRFPDRAAYRDTTQRAGACRAWRSSRFDALLNSRRHIASAGSDSDSLLIHVKATPIASHRLEVSKGFETLYAYFHCEPRWTATVLSVAQSVALVGNSGRAFLPLTQRVQVPRVSHIGDVRGL
jgi:hypothetical protein